MGQHFAKRVDELGIRMVMADDGWKVADEDVSRVEWLLGFCESLGAEVTVEDFERAYNGTERRFPDIPNLST